MIYKNLKDLRKNNGLTQEQLSEKIGVSRQAIASGRKEKVYLIYIVYWSFLMFTL